MRIPNRVISSIYISKQGLITLILFIVYPLLSLPFIIQGMFKYQKWAFILFSCFMGLVGLLFPPTGDFYRYTQDALFIKNLSWDEFLVYSFVKFDYFLVYLSYVLTHLGVNFDISRFIYNTIGYLLLSKIFLELLEYNKEIKKKYRCIFFGLFICISLNMFLYRFFFSMILFLYGSYQIIIFHRKTGALFLMWAVLNHLSFIIFVIGFIGQRLGLFRFNRYIIAILCFIACFLDSNVVKNLFQILPVQYIDRYMIYLDGYWAGDYLEDHSLRYRIMLIVSSFITYSSILIYYLIYDKINKEKKALTNYILLLVAFMSPFATIVGRFLTVLSLSIKIIFMYSFKDNSLFRKCAYVLFYLTLLDDGMGIWSCRKELIMSDSNILLYGSFPSIITHSYSEDWLNRNVFEDGDFKRKE